MSSFLDRFRPLYRKEKLYKTERKVTLLGKEFFYMTHAKRQYEQQKQQINFLKSIIDITKLKPASGPLRERQLELTKFANEICSQLYKVDIKPFLIAGNLVGQLRHQGFVPWDDDIDFALMREEYNTLLNYCKNNFHVADMHASKERRQSTYYNLMDSIMKAHPNEVILIQHSYHLKLIKGKSIADFIFLDFFPLDYISEDKTVKEYDELSKKTREECIKIRDMDKIREHQDKITTSSPMFCKKSNKVYYGIDNLDSYKKDHHRFFNLDEILPLKKAKYENVEFYIPNKPIDFVNNQFEDYMAFPDDVGYTKHISNTQKFAAKKNKNRK